MVDQGMGFVVLGLWASCIEQVLTMQYLVDSKMGFAGTLWLFCAENLLCLLFVVIFIKETKGLTDTEKKNLYAPTQPLT